MWDTKAIRDLFCIWDRINFSRRPIRILPFFPLNESFQFDTSFMYICVVLGFVKIYQYRHPDITLNAYAAFTYISVMLIFEVVGCYAKRGIFTFLFISTYFGIIFKVIVGLYFENNFSQAMRSTWIVISGSKQDGTKAIKNIFSKETIAMVKSGTTHRHVFFLIISIMNICLGGYILYSMLNSNESFVSYYILLIFAANAVGYKFYYITMKCYFSVRLKKKSESVSWTCWIYIILLTALASTGVAFYMVKEYNTEISPSESRHLNTECRIGIFDTHDIWHFASAFACFFECMVLLTLEDNNTSTPWKKIPVF